MRRRTDGGDPSPRHRLDVSTATGDAPKLAAPSSATRSAEFFQLRVLGPFELTRPAAASLALPKKGQGLLAYLALQSGRAIPRQRLATLLWDAAGTEQARRSLRECLRSLGAALGPAAGTVLAATNSGADVALSQNVQVDVRQFDVLGRSSRLQDLEAAHDLYRGELLTGLQVSAEPFNDWLTLERQRLASTMSDLLLRLAGARARGGDLDGGIRAAQRLVSLDPLREEGHRVLIEFLAAAGRRDAALKQHAHCVDILRRELGIAPEPATTELAHRIRSGRLPLQSAVSAPSGGPATPERITARAPPVGDAPHRSHKASIAVFPFVDLGSDADPEHVADGITEEITNALGRLPRLFVIAGGPASDGSRSGDIRQIGRELGTQYVLRGSVRRLGDRMRVIVQVVETAQGGQVWSERFEGSQENVFEIQDRIAAHVAAMVGPALDTAEIERVHLKRAEHLTAYDLYLQAVPKFRKNQAENQQALHLLRRAIELDPSYAAAFALAARCLHFQKVMGWVHPADPRLDEGVRMARTAAELGRNDSEVLWMTGLALIFLAGELADGATLIEKSLSLNPNSANAWIAACFAHGFLGDTERATDDFDRAQHLNPLDMTHHVRWNAVGNAHFIAGRHEEAEKAADITLREAHTYPPGLRLKITTCGLLGRLDESRQYVHRLLTVNPDASVSSLRAFWAPLLRRSPNALGRYLEGLRRAGMPEK